MARKVTIPGQSVSVDLNATGGVRPEWYEKLKFLETLQPLTDIVNPTFSVTTLTPGNTTTSITNRTVSFDNGGLGGSDTGVLGVGTASNPQQNSWVTTGSIIGQFSANHTAHKNASDALNARVTALENKINAVINDLRARFP